jgi:hypothetical protein
MRRECHVDLPGELRVARSRSNRVLRRLAANLLFCISALGATVVSAGGLIPAPKVSVHLAELAESGAINRSPSSPIGVA